MGINYDYSWLIGVEHVTDSSIKFERLEKIVNSSVIM
jgi:hypothetical protein